MMIHNDDSLLKPISMSISLCKLYDIVKKMMPNNSTVDIFLRLRSIRNYEWVIGVTMAG